MTQGALRIVQQDGSVRPLLPEQVRLTPLDVWQAEDATRYPVDWRLQVPELQLDLEVKAVLDNQLMDHSVHYWEGAVDVLVEAIATVPTNIASPTTMARATVMLYAASSRMVPFAVPPPSHIVCSP